MPAPIVYAVTPKSVAAAGGKVVQIVGRNLDPTTTVTIAAAAATSTLVSTFLTNSVAPAHAAGAADVVVTNSSGNVTVTAGVTYV